MDRNSLINVYSSIAANSGVSSPLGEVVEAAGIQTFKRSPTSQTIATGTGAILSGTITLASDVTLTIAGTGLVRII